MLKLFQNGKIPLRDFLEACQFHFHCHGRPLIDDDYYDDLRKLVTMEDPVRRGVVHYPQYIRSLSSYLSAKQSGYEELDREQAQKLIDQEQRIEKLKREKAREKGE